MYNKMSLRLRTKKLSDMEPVEEKTESKPITLEDQFRHLKEKYNQFEQDQNDWKNTIKKTIQEQFVKALDEQKTLQLTLHKTFQDQCKKEQEQLLEQTVRDIGEKGFSLPKWEEVKTQLTQSIHQHVKDMIHTMETEQHHHLQCITEERDKLQTTVRDLTTELHTIQEENRSLQQRCNNVVEEKKQLHNEHTSIKHNVSHAITELDRIKMKLLVSIPVEVRTKSCCSNCIIS